MINQTPERLKQKTVKKDLYKGKNKLVTMQQQKTNVISNMDSQQCLEPEYKNKAKYFKLIYFLFFL